MKTIGLIFDSNKNIGEGHFWRCFNLAKVLKINTYAYGQLQNRVLSMGQEMKDVNHEMDRYRDNFKNCFTI